MNKIVPYLWFDTQAEEAARFYASLFKNSAVGTVTRYGEAGAKPSGRPVGSVMTVEFRLVDQDFIALNGGPTFTFSPAISLFVNCRTQKEVDRLYDGLVAGGEEQAVVRSRRWLSIPACRRRSCSTDSALATITGATRFPRGPSCFMARMELPGFLTGTVRSSLLRMIPQA